MMAKPMKTLDLHYPMIQFLIIDVIQWTLPAWHNQKGPPRAEVWAFKKIR